MNYPTYFTALRGAGYTTAVIGKSHLWSHRRVAHLREGEPYLQAPGFDTIDLVDDRSQGLIDPIATVADGYDPELRTLPKVRVVSFGDRHVELLQAILHAPQDTALVLERLCMGEVKIDHQQANDWHQRSVNSRQPTVEGQQPIVD